MLYLERNLIKDQIIRVASRPKSGTQVQSRDGIFTVLDDFPTIDLMDNDTLTIIPIELTNT